MLRRALPLIVLGGTILGCQLPGETDGPRTFRAPPESVGEGEGAIRDGYIDEGDPAAVGIAAFQGQGVGLCSGSLIAPNLVLTARHCVSDTYNDSQGVRCGETSSGTPFDAADFFVTTRPQFEQNASAYRGVREVVTLPVEDDFCGQDMAILILAESIPPEEATPYVPRVDTALAAAEEYYAIGYGATDDAGSGSGVRRRRDGLFVECAEDGCGTRWDMKVSEWLGDEGICSGDSGGPAIDLQGRVVGVTSRGIYGCDDPIYGSPHGWGQWIKDTAAYAAQLGGYAPAPWVSGYPTDPAYSFPVGQACVAPSDCASNTCYGGFCTRPCNELAVCPEGFLCEPPEGSTGPLCVPEPEPEPEDDDDDTSAASDGGSSDGDAAEDAGGGCTASGKDPVTPVPWLVGVALAGLGLARRRRR